MLIKTIHICGSTKFGIQHVKEPQDLVHNPSSNMFIFNLKENQGLLSLSTYTRLQRLHNRKRTYIVYSGAVPAGIPPSGPPPPNTSNWVVAVAIALVVPFISYKWGPTLKSKIDMVMQKTEDAVEAVEKVAEKVEKVAEDILDDLPKGGKLREAVDLLEKLAERTRMDAEAVDDFIDKVQEEEEKAKSLQEEEEKAKSLQEEEEKAKSLKDEPKSLSG